MPEDLPQDLLVVPARRPRGGIPLSRLPSDRQLSWAEKAVADGRINDDEDKRERVRVQETVEIWNGTFLEPLADGYILVAKGTDPQRWHVEATYETDDYVYHGWIDEAAAKGSLLLPERVGLPLGPDKLLDDVMAFSRPYVDMPEEDRFLCSAYVLLSWVFESFTALPILRFKGDTGSGKSRALKVFGGLLYKVLCTGGSATVASSRRLLDEWKGSWAIDEGNWHHTGEKDDITKVLCARFEDSEFSNWMGVREQRSEGVEVNRIWGPTAICTRGSFSDKALEGRCLTVVMMETSREDVPVNTGLDFIARREALRQNLLAFRVMMRAKGWEAPDLSKEDWGDLRGIEPRAKQIVEPLLQLLGEQRARVVEFVKRHVRRVIEERSSSPEGVVINALHRMVTDPGVEDVPRPTAGEIAASIEGEKMTAQMAGRLLGRLGLRSRRGRGGRRYYDVLDPDNERAYQVAVRRYVIDEGGAEGVVALAQSRLDEDSGGGDEA